MNSWDTLRRKLAPNPQQHKTLPTMLAGMAATLGGAALVYGGLITMFGITAFPTSVGDLRTAATWRLLMGIAGLFIMWRVISHGNNLFGLAHSAGYSWTICGAIAFAVVVRDLVISSMDLRVTADVLRDPLLTALILAAFVAGALLFRVGNLWFARSGKYAAPVIRNPADVRGLDYCLYLRTFGQDDVLAGAQAFTRPKRALRSLFVIEPPEEGQLADALSSDDIPMVAVGRPGEVAPPVGALRMYLPRDDWQPSVRELMVGARHVVLALGRGEGTLWELGEAARILEPKQLILVVPMDKADYDRFRQETAKIFPAGLPLYAGREEMRTSIRGLVTFTEGWNGNFVPLRAYSPIHSSLRIALIYAAWPALRRLGYPPRGFLRTFPNLVQEPGRES